MMATNDREVVYIIGHDLHDLHEEVWCDSHVDAPSMQRDHQLVDSDDDDLVLRSIQSSFGRDLPGLHTVDEDVVLLHRGRGLLWFMGIIVLALLALLLPQVEEDFVFVSDISVPDPGLQCPATEPASVSATSSDTGIDELFNQYDSIALEVASSSAQDFMQTFRNRTFDNWGTTYETVKQGMLEWKSTKFAPNLQNGDRIFESACGIGLNLLMTIEVLQDSYISQIQVNGNDYVASSVDLATKLWDEFVTLSEAGFQAQRGSFCQADSTHLSFIPDDEFDLVFTGYITPLLDPLNLGRSESYARQAELCANSNDWPSLKLLQIAQERQQDWYGTWVSEMIRIAKPGRAIIVEHVSQPLCESPRDWGGVAREFWHNAVGKYGWDVDPESIEMQEDVLYEKRYHVFMRKLSLADEGDDV